MPKPRIYANDAEKAKAYRLRKKFKSNQHRPELQEVIEILHRFYQGKAKASVGYAPELVGKTPNETLLNILVYGLITERVGAQDNESLLRIADKFRDKPPWNDPKFPQWLFDRHLGQPQEVSDSSTASDAVEDEKKAKRKRVTG